MKMKLILSTLIACFFVTQSLDAQWTKIGVTMGYDQDRIQGLSANYIAGATTMDLVGVDLGRFNSSTLYSMACENPHVRAYTSYDFSQFSNVSANFALVGIFNRWDDVSYYMDNEYVSFGSISHEVAFESTIDKRLKLWNVLYLDLGAGGNLGVGFGGYSYMNYFGESNEFMLNRRTVTGIVTADDVSWQQEQQFYGDISGKNKTSLHGRLFGKIGAGVIIFNKVELGAAMRYGVGMRKHIEGSFARTEFVSLESNLAYRF